VCVLTTLHSAPLRPHLALVLASSLTFLVPQQAALSDPALTVPGFDSSRVFALISVVLSSPSSPKKRLVKRIKTVYLFQVDNDKGDKAQWWLDMKVRSRSLFRRRALELRGRLALSHDSWWS